MDGTPGLIGFHLLIWVHVLSACLWVGGSLFLVVVLLPVLRREKWSQQYRALLHDVVIRFRAIAWATLGTLVVTGVALAHRSLNGHWETMMDTPWGNTLATKISVVGLILALAAFHDWRTGPAAMKALADDPTGKTAVRVRAVATWVGRINLLLGLAVVWLAVGLPRGL